MRAFFSCFFVDLICACFISAKGATPWKTIALWILLLPSNIYNFLRLVFSEDIPCIPDPFSLHNVSDNIRRFWKRFLWDPVFSSTECEMYQEIIATKGRGNLKKVVTNTYGFTTDDKLLTGVNSSLPSQGIEEFRQVKDDNADEDLDISNEYWIFW